MKPFIEMPKITYVWNGFTDGAPHVLLSDVREMREKYEARIRELTEWRPMSTAPMGRENLVLVIRNGRRYVGEVLGDGRVYTESKCLDCADGWLPLPEVPR